MADAFQRTISTGDILAETTAMVGRNAVLIALAAVVVAGELYLFDLIQQQLGVVSPGTRALYASTNLPFRMLIDYAIAALLIASERLNPNGWSVVSLGSYIVMSVLGGLGMIAGFVLLVVPGVILVVRWSIAGNFAIARRLGPIAALRASWQATRGSAGAIFGVLALFAVVNLVVLFGISGHFVGTPTVLSPTMAVVRNLYLGAAGAVYLCVNVATYGLLAGIEDRSVGDVFA